MRPKARKTKLFIFVLAAIILLAVSIGLHFQKKFTEVRFTGVSEVEENLETVVNEIISDASVGIFGSRYLTKNPDKILEEISGKVFHEVETIVLDKSVIDIAFSQPVPELLVCSDTTSECFFLDERKEGYLPGPNIVGGGIPRLSIDLDNGELIPVEQTRYILNILRLLQESEITIDEVRISQDEYRFFADRIQGYEVAQRPSVLFPPSGNFNDVNARDVLAKMSTIREFWGEFTEDPESLEYIDLRFSGQFIYKFTENS